MRRRIAQFVRSVTTAVRLEAAAPLGVALATVFALLAAAVGIPDDRWKSWLGAHAAGYAMQAQTALALLFLVLLAANLVRVTWRLRPDRDPVGDLDKSRFYCRVLDTMEDAHQINDDLVREIFPDGSIQIDHAIRAQERNPRRLLGLIDSETDEIAGWSSIWPVKVNAGMDIEQGKRVDDDLKVDDLLPANRNLSARYLVLLSFGIRPKYRGGSECPTRRLGRFVIDHILSEFIGPSDRKIRLVAVAYSPQGKRLCALLGLTHNRLFADYGEKVGKKPIYVGEMGFRELMELNRKA